MQVIRISKTSKVPKYKQIVTAVETAIATGRLKKGDRLPSLNAIRQQHELSRDTVLVAFNELKNRGIINSVVGKGYYVSNEDIAINHKVFLLFDELNSFKEDLYNSFLDELADNVQVDVYFHHFNQQIFDKTIQDHLGEYNSYVIMPANLKGATTSIGWLPEDKVFILDQVNEALSSYPAVFQNFAKDMYEGLVSLKEKLNKYKHLYFLFAPDKQPQGLMEGVTRFCRQENLDLHVLNNLIYADLQRNSVYLVLDDRSLLHVVKKAKEQNFQLAKDIGVICYNDSLLKEIVADGITTISTDFQLMGKQLAQMIQSRQHKRIENKSYTIIRNSI